MKVSYRWLSEYVDLPMDPQELALRLTERGVAVEEVVAVNRGVRGVLSGRIVAMEPHPAAERLVMCKLDVGGGTGGAASGGAVTGGPLTIVTGATNPRVGDIVPVAVPGSSLPNEWKIEAGDFRGILSQGMLCSETELLEGLPHKETEGVWVLPEDTPVGRPMVDLLDLDDHVLELDLTPNYASHALSMVGVAREVAAITGGQVRLPKPPPTLSTGEAGELVQVQIEDTQLCRRYVARVMRGVNLGQSPLWMQNRLRTAGMRPISNLVDITNYVMLELGQPLHAFDYDRMEGRRVVVRRARPGETMVTLDGQERKLDPDMLVIADASRPEALAGVMGGLDSEVGPETRTILLESAHFNGGNVRRTSRRLGLSSEAGTRFVKGTDINGALLAADRACELAASLGAAQPVAGAVDVYPTVRTPLLIPLRPARANRLLGLSLSETEMIDCLNRLGLSTLRTADLTGGEAAARLDAASPRPLREEARQAWARAIDEKVAAARAGGAPAVPGEARLFVAVPTRRPDLTEEVDLLEEIARIDGYDQIPATLPTGTTSAGGRTRAQNVARQAREILLGAGYSQVISYSFESDKDIDNLRLPADHPWRRQLRIQNPVSEDYAVMRTTLLTSLLGVLQHNQSWRQGDAQIFHMGAVFHPRSLPVTELPEERWKLGLAATGLLRPKRWNQAERAVDFYDVKGAVEALLASLGCPTPSFARCAQPFLHPGRQAELTAAGRSLGFLGELHPRVQAHYNLPNRVVVAELDWEGILDLAGTGRSYRPLGRYPSVVRDVALVLPVDVPAAQVRLAIEEAGGALLEDVRLFDLYEGQPIPAGRRSLAYSLTYRAEDRTLTEAEVDDAHSTVRQALAEKLGAELRS